MTEVEGQNERKNLSAFDRKNINSDIKSWVGRKKFFF